MQYNAQLYAKQTNKQTGFKDNKLETHFSFYSGDYLALKMFGMTNVLLEIQSDPELSHYII